jgi:hypothetical protein
MLLIKNDGHIYIISDKKNLGWLSSFIISLFYDASKLSTVYVENHQLKAFRGHFFSKVKIFFKSEN